MPDPLQLGLSQNAAHVLAVCIYIMHFGIMAAPNENYGLAVACVFF